MDKEQELARSIATYAAKQYVLLHSAGEDDEWLDTTPEKLDEAVRELVSASARYLDMRGLLERGTYNPNMVRILDEPES